MQLVLLVVHSTLRVLFGGGWWVMCLGTVTLLDAGIDVSLLTNV